MQPTGFVKIDRQMLNWEWFCEPNTAHLFVYCLLQANWTDGRFQGMAVPRGSFVTSYNKLAVSTGLSVRSVRTALNHLKATGEISIKSFKKYSLIYINNYEKYQNIPTQTPTQYRHSPKPVKSRLPRVEGSHTDTQTDTPTDNNIRNKEYKNKEYIYKGKGNKKPSFNYEQRDWDFDEFDKIKREELIRDLERTDTDDTENFKGLPD